MVSGLVDKQGAVDYYIMFMYVYMYFICKSTWIVQTVHPAHSSLLAFINYDMNMWRCLQLKILQT